MFDASTWDRIRSMHIIKDEIKMVKGHHAYITRMHKPLALMGLTTITMSKNSYQYYFAQTQIKCSGQVSNHALCLYDYKKKKVLHRGKLLWPCYDQ